MLNQPWIFGAILVVQSLCGFFFVSDILLTVVGAPIGPIPWAYREVMELAAAIGLILGVVLGALLLRASLRRTRSMERSLRAASGAFMEIVEERFAEWTLTPAERDVALFALKGMSIAEIASLRQTSQGTVKAQTNAIYRKAGVTGRPQLLSLFVDELLDGTPAPQAPAAVPVGRGAAPEPQDPSSA
ncbi:helix-turn-helix transcriptional regulator [Roseibacterium sp. SDUM158017]|uniref:helix-turn-helix transcriptional regulator n=1 Tax=Roseicyclus salinarum TaxID=3036773 RepID=UPI0024158D47|nr:helix-turn-helix transcriptional regulator [Roseibacterium sp. SDUM158017]MDG4647305.1 helix-turn-helix transcriptional regulator [Roseibacterium sp. SDUM158017]